MTAHITRTTVSAYIIAASCTCGWRREFQNPTFSNRAANKAHRIAEAHRLEMAK